MSKRLKALCLLAFGVALMTLPVLAQGEAPAGELAQPRADLFKLSLIVGGAIISLAVIAGAFCQSRGHLLGVRGDLPQPGRRARHPRPAHPGARPHRDPGHLRPAHHHHHPDGPVG